MKKTIQEAYERRIKVLDPSVRIYRDKQEGIAQLFTDYVIGSISDTDLNITAATLSDFIEHSVFLYNYALWGDIPLDVFLNFVVNPRCSKELVAPCRALFYDEVSHLITKNCIDTILAINYWCAAHVKYQLTDPRTKSARFSFESGSGRCGEKATFLAQVYRSVGIPARVAYVPFWSHTDDNHAWVEVYHDGHWSYLGAGEGEEVLEKAWFTSATTRAPYIFSNLASFLTDSLTCLSNDRLWTVIDHTSHYRSEKNVCVKTNIMQIHTADIVILNYGSFRTLHSVQFEQGSAHFRFGGGDCFIKAVVDNCVYFKHIPSHATEVHIGVEDVIKSVIYFEQKAAPGFIPTWKTTTMENERRDLKRKQANDAYLKKMEHLRNHPINRDAFRRLREHLGSDAESVIKHMKPKDLMDFDPCIYSDHFKRVAQYRSNYDAEIFFKYVATPRVFWEELTPYAAQFQEKFKAMTAWIKQPSLIKTWVDETIKETSIYAVPNTYVPQNRLLDHPFGSAMDKKIMIVAIARSLGIAARYNERKDDVEYYEAGNFKSFSNERKQISLTLTGDLAQFVISINPLFEIGCLTERTLSVENTTALTEQYLQGTYEIVASKRLPSGQQVGSLQIVDATEDIVVAIPDVEVELEDVIEDVYIGDLLEEMGLPSTHGILIFGDPSEEPTVHSIQELVSMGTLLSNHTMPIVLVNRVENTSWKQCEGIEQLKTYTEKRNISLELETMMARRLYREPKVYPLYVIYKDGLSKLSGSGYRVNALANPWVKQIIGGDKLCGR